MRFIQSKIASIKTYGGFFMAHKFVISKTKSGEYKAAFKYNSETIFWTEGYSSKAGAKNAIESIQKNGPSAPVEEDLG